MVLQCIVPGCKGGSRARFRFPHPELGKERFQVWLNIIRNPILEDQEPRQIYDSKRICARHFEPECFYKPKRLKFSAIPTLYVPAPEAAKDWSYSQTRDYQPCRLLPPPESTDFADVSLLQDEHSYTVLSQQPKCPQLIHLLKRNNLQAERKKHDPSQPLSSQQIGALSPELQCDIEGIAEAVTTDDHSYTIPTTQPSNHSIPEQALLEQVNDDCTIVKTLPSKRHRTASEDEPKKRRIYSRRFYSKQVCNQLAETQCETEKANVEWVCLLCRVRTENGVPLNYTTIIEGEESRTLSEIISECCNAKVCLDDSKPQSICVDCAEKARAAYEFRKCCLKSDLLLRVDNDTNTESEVTSCNEFERTEKNVSMQTINEPKAEVTNLPKHSPSIQATVKMESRTETQCDKSTNVRTKYGVKLLKKCKTCRKTKVKVVTKKKQVNRRISKGDNSPVCLQCYRNLKRQAVHFKSCIKKKWYCCIRCGARFSNPRNLSVHEVSHYSVLHRLLNNSKKEGLCVLKTKKGFVIK